MNSAPQDRDHATGRGSMLRTNLLEAAGLAIVFWQGTIDSQEDVDAIRQAVTTKIGRADIALDFSEVETLGSGTLAVSVCTVAYGQSAGNPPRNLQPSAGILPDAAKGLFLVPDRRSREC